MHQAETTLDLLARARAGDDAALETLFARYLPPLRRWAAGRLPQWARDVADTQDLVQDSLLQTFRKLDNFEPRGEDAFRAYLRQAVMNRVRDEIRRRRRTPDNTTLKTAEPARVASPLEEAIGSEALERYEHALERLRDSDRHTVVARVELGLSWEELADALGKPSVEAARKAAQRALVRLAEEMRRG